MIQGSTGRVNGHTGSSPGSLWQEKIKQVETAHSPLWNEEVRNIVSKHMMTQHQIDSRRSELLVPGML